MGLLNGAYYLVRGIKLALRPRVRRWTFLPLVVSVLLYGLLLWPLYHGADQLSAYVAETLPSFFAWFANLVVAIFWLASAVILTFAFVIVVGIVAAPFNGPLAAAAERAISNAPPQTSSKSLWQGLLAIPHVISQETKKLSYSALWAIPFLLLFIVPFVNLLAPILWFCFSSWIAALGFCDYILDNHDVPFEEMRRRLRANLSTSLGFGGATVLLLSIPLAGLIAVPGAVCGGTLYYLEVLSKE